MSQEPIHIAACGICCSTCGLYRKGICLPCGSGLKKDEEVVKKKMEEQMRNMGRLCPRLQCAIEKKIGYCMSDCQEFPCKFYERGPYSERFLTMYKTRNK